MKTRTTIAALLVASALAAPAVAQEVTIKIADSLPADHIITRNTTEIFMEKVKEQLGDRVAFEHYPAEQLAKAKDMLSITQAGIADIGYIVPSYVSEKMPLGGVVELPGEIASSCEGSLAFRELVQPGGKLDELEFQPNGVRVLYNVALSPYQAVFSKRAGVANLADMAGKKVRSNPGAMELSLQAVGAAPIRMTPPEIFDAMSKGTIDGALLPFTSTFSYGLDQIVTSASQDANFGSVGITYSISQKKWDSLPEDVQKVLSEVGREVTQSACKAFDDAEVDLAEQMKADGANVFTLTEEEKATLSETFGTVAEDWAKALDDRGKVGTEILTDFRTEVEKIRGQES
ncbi:TRAP transporter substrate-binding protein DctP [Marinovum sp. SP66]|uniref:TRAP transporter substrate-binding protein n=1 Tax=Marinovum sp. SP66 TaxID=3028379 RepID=UPI00237A67BB|nr:TRAP transporter substrate-binding protein DctP [Marinovum sp. SP66]MDD9739790.1 TRAP transporter substrate-binding protein DctP [Marinovum sp. SP66]